MNSTKIWTNDRLVALRGTSKISVVGEGPKAAPDTSHNSSKEPHGTPQTYVLPEKDPSWYGTQLNQIDSELQKTNQQIRQIHSAIQNGTTSGSVAMVVDYSDLGVSTDGTLQRLEKRKHELQGKANELEEMARKNGLEPGSLRSAEEEASQSANGNTAEDESEASKIEPVTPEPSGPTVAKDESYWRGAFRDLHHRLSQAQTELDVLQREWGELSVQYYPDPARAMREAYTRHEINQHKQAIDAKKKEIVQLLQQISDLEDDLRKAGGDPGWSRPQKTS